MARGSVLSAARTRLSRSRRLRYIQNYYMRRTSVLVIMVLMAGALTLTGPLRADAQVSQSLGTAPSVSHSSARSPVVRSEADGVSALSGALSDSLSNAVPGATIDVDPAGTHCLGTTPVASTTTGSGGSFSVSVSPATYDVWVNYPGDSTDPAFAVCTDSVDLSASVTDALTFPVTRLTVTAQDSSGDPVQGATVLGSGQTQTLAGFDLFPGQPIYPGYSYLTPDHNFTTSAAGIAVVPLMPMTSPLTLSVAPPADSGLGGTTVNAGTMTTDTAVTATLDGPPYHQTQTTLSTSPNPSSYGQSVTFTATVSPTDGGGTVSFTADGNPVAGCSGLALTFVSGNYEVVCITSSMAAGSHVIDAAYTGDTNYSGSSGTANESVTQEPTTTALRSKPASSMYGQEVTFTATVSPTDGQGKVSFISTTGKKTAVLCPGQSLSRTGDFYQASCVTSSLAAGTHTVIATYSGDTDFSKSSASLRQTVKKSSTATAISSSKNPSSYGQSVTFTATVSSGDGGGTVTFRQAGHTISGCVGEPLHDNAGSYQVTCTTSSLLVGAEKIRAVYTGDKDCLRSTGTLRQVVIYAHRR